MVFKLKPLSCMSLNWKHLGLFSVCEEHVFVSWIEWSHRQEIHLCHRDCLCWLLLCSSSIWSSFLEINNKSFSSEQSNHSQTNEIKGLFIYLNVMSIKFLANYMLHEISKLIFSCLRTASYVWDQSRNVFIALQWRQSSVDDRSVLEVTSITLWLQLIISLLCPTSNKQ